MKEYNLDQLFDLQMGKTPARQENSFWIDGKHDWISIKDLSNSGKYISETNEQLSDVAVEKTGIKIIPKNTVIMSFKLSIGKVAITSKDMYSNEAIMAFHDRKIENIIPEYLYYLLLGNKWVEGSNTAVMGITLNKATLSKIKIRIHDSEIQKEIVQVLNNLDRQIESKKVQLSEYDQLIKSRFVEMFGNPDLNDKKWSVLKIKDIATCVAGATPSTLVNEYWENGTIPWMSSGEVNKGRIFETEKKITELGYANASTRLVPPKTVVLAMAGQGKTRGIPAITEIELCTNQSICSLVSNGKTNSDFLYHLLLTQYENLRNESNSSGGRGGLNLSIIGNYKIIVPPIIITKHILRYGNSIYN
jgi:restriction endonuclease S subunit